MKQAKHILALVIALWLPAGVLNAGLDQALAQNNDLGLSGNTPEGNLPRAEFAPSTDGSPKADRSDSGNDGRQVAQTPAVLPAARPPGAPAATAHGALAPPEGSIYTEAALEPAVSGGVITVRVKVPHNKKVYDHFTAYPYPVKPLKITQENKPLSEDPKEVKSMLLTLGYTARTAAQKAYPLGGWRWQYAYNAALRKTGEGVPHFLFEMYPWCDRMLKSIMPEIQRLNAAEELRAKKYKKAMDEYERTYSECENEATRRGLFPQDFKMRGLGVGSARLAAGTWWVAGYHKAAGITYYWYSPVTIRDGEKPTYDLTEGNALVIQGAW